MLNPVFIKIGWLLAALVSCYASSIQLESLETRLCRATFGEYVIGFGEFSA